MKAKKQNQNELDYFKKLYVQYCYAKGMPIRDKDIHDESFIKWINSNFILSEQYGEYLKEINTNIGDRLSTEIGKGIYDSIASDVENMDIVSPYASLMGYENKRFALLPDNEDGIVMPYVFSKDNRIDTLNSGIVVTHNPYNARQFLSLSDLHNQESYDISIGMYGDLCDEDREQKLMFLKYLRDNMSDDCTYDYDTLNGNYFASLNSKRVIKQLLLNKYI